MTIIFKLKLFKFIIFKNYFALSIETKTSNMIMRLIILAEKLKILKIIYLFILFISMQNS